MDHPGELQRRILLTATVVFLVAAQAGQSARAELTTALVPMYTYAGTDPASWTHLDQSANKIIIDAIINPASGPGTFQDPSYVSAIAALDATKFGKGLRVHLHITDGTGGNPYGQLPSYWDQEVAALAATPEPSSLLVAAACGLVACAVGSLRRRSRTQRRSG